MKRILPAVMMLMTGMAATAHADDKGTVSFSGNVTGSTCNVSVNGQGPDGTVTLPDVTADDLNTSQTAGETKFTFTLTNCAGSYKTARAFFENGPTVDSRNYLINTGGTATGVMLQLEDNTKKAINPGDTSNMGPYTDISSGSASMDYYVLYAVVDGPAVGGTVESSVTYHLDYK